MTNGDRYRSLRDVLRDEFTEQERQELYSKLIQMLKAVIIRPENVMGIAQAADDLADFVRHNADVMEDVKRILQQFLSKRSYNLAWRAEDIYQVMIKCLYKCTFNIAVQVSLLNYIVLSAWITIFLLNNEINSRKQRWVMI